MPDPIIFLHLQKTGGTSLRSVFRDVFGATYVCEQNDRANDGRWVTPLSGKQTRARAWLGHMSFGLHSVLPSPVPYFTVVRDPVEREVSRFRCMPQMRRNGKTPVTSMSKVWGAVFILSGAPFNEIDELTSKHVDDAIRNLHEHFLFVGDTSRMDDVGRFLRDELRWPVELPLPHENKSGQEVTVTDQERRELRANRQVQLDQMLYDRIVELGPYPKEWRL